MRKSWIFILLGLFIFAGLGGSYFYLKNASKSSKLALSGIPTNALLIWRADNPITSLGNLAHNSILWEELAQSDKLKETNTSLTTWDSILNNQAEIASILEESTMYFSWHPSGKADIGWLAILELEEGTSASDLVEMLALVGDKSKERTFEDTHIYSWRLNKTQYHWSIQKDLLFFSSYGSLVELGVKQSKADSSFLTNEQFARIQETAGSPENGVLFYNTAILGNAAKPFFNVKTQQQLNTIFQSTGGWVAQDLSIKSDAVMLSGFTTYTDSSGCFLEAFETQQPEDHDAVNVMPLNTVGFIHYGFSNLNGWFSKKRDALEVKDELYEFDKVLADQENKFGFSYEKHLFTWMEHEVLAGFLEGRTQEIQNDFFCITKAGNVKLAEKNLAELANRTALLVTDQTMPTDSGIGYIAIPQLLSPIFGEPFHLLEETYYTFIGKYVIWANSPRVLNEIKSQYKAENTLGNSDGFKQLQEHVSEESNIFLYINVARSSEYLYQFLNTDFAPKSEAEIAYLRKFQAFTYQYSFERPQLFYTHSYFVHNPIYKEVSYSLWELALEAPVDMKPVVVKNHYTGAKEIFIQDRDNTIYLISNSGKILWKRPLSERILSEVQQIDVYGNNKLQILFNTKSKVFLIDRNGHDVPGYSIELEEKAIAGLTCLDFAGNNKYRILVPAENGTLYDFDNDGKPVSGWKHKNESSNIIRPIQFFSIKNKDYLIAQLADGSVKAYDRRGRIRVNAFEEKLTTKPSPTHLTVGNSLNTTYLTISDSSGTINRLYLNGTLDKSDYTNLSPNHLFQYTDLNQDGNKDYLYADKNKIVGYNNNGELILEYEIAQGQIIHMNTYNFETGVSIGLTSNSGEIYLIDKTEQLYPFFPMQGIGEFTITDLNADGTFDLLVGDNSGLLYCYRLEK